MLAICQDDAARSRTLWEKAQTDRSAFVVVEAFALAMLDGEQDNSDAAEFGVATDLVYFLVGLVASNLAIRWVNNYFNRKDADSRQEQAERQVELVNQMVADGWHRNKPITFVEKAFVRLGNQEQNLLRDIAQIIQKQE